MISYEPLFRTMKEKGITSYRLEKMGFNRSTYYSIKVETAFLQILSNSFADCCTAAWRILSNLLRTLRAGCFGSRLFSPLPRSARMLSYRRYAV